MAWEGSDAGTSVVNAGGTGGDVPSTDQSRKRSYAIYTDQHGRAWGAIIENKTGDPCGPLEPQFHAPVLPLDKFVTINSRQRKLTIRYADIILDKEDADTAWEASLREYARKLYDDKAPGAIEHPTPALIDLVGPKPKGRREIWEAAMQGNKWILGFDAKKPAWAEEFFPTAAQEQKRREVKVTRTYPDADEEPEGFTIQAPVKYPRWDGPKTGWQLSDGSFVTRLEGEDKESYKNRADTAEANLGV